MVKSRARYGLAAVFLILFAALFQVARTDTALAQTGQELPERPLKTRVIQSGHSLTDPIPELLRQMVRASGVYGAVVDRSTIPGSPIEIRWNSQPGDMPDARADIGKYDLLVLTEGAPIAGIRRDHRSDEFALRWFKHAWTEGGPAETILYATWVEHNSGPGSPHDGTSPDGEIPFRERMPIEMAQWEGIRTHVNANRPEGSPPMQMIPGPVIMAALYDEIEAGTAPGFQHISDVFADEIHLNDKGNYLIALAHFMVIYGRDPRGLPHNLGENRVLTPEQAVWMQELVWRVVNEYSHQQDKS